MRTETRRLILKLAMTLYGVYDTGQRSMIHRCKPGKISFRELSLKTQRYWRRIAAVVIQDLNLSTVQYTKILKHNSSRVELEVRKSTYRKKPSEQNQKCTICGHYEYHPTHIQYGNDLDNPMKHDFKPRRST